MELYILRHGIAAEGRAGQPDSERALTAEGKRKLRAVLKVARDGGVRPTLIMTSPFRRAAETAELAAAIFDYKGEIVSCAALIPSARVEAAWDEVRLHRDEAQVMICGHEPLFSGLTAYLLGSPTVEVDFKKGALARIDFERVSAAPRGVLKWMLVPALAK